jgi:hypothetical protein
MTLPLCYERGQLPADEHTLLNGEQLAGAGRRLDDSAS